MIILLLIACNKRKLVQAIRKNFTFLPIKNLLTPTELITISCLARSPVGGLVSVGPNWAGGRVWLPPSHWPDGVRPVPEPEVQEKL